MTPPAEPPVPSPHGSRRRPTCSSSASTTRITVDGDDGHHLQRVRRLRAGEHVTAADGYGRWRAVRGRAQSPAVRVDLERDRRSSRTSRRSRRGLTVAFALTKGQKPGARGAEADRAGRRPDHARARRRARSCAGTTPRSRRPSTRLERVAREAAMQCRRARLPVVDGPVAPASWRGSPAWSSPTVDGAPPPSSRRPPDGGVGGRRGPRGRVRRRTSCAGLRRGPAPGRRTVRPAGRDRGDRGWPPRLAGRPRRLLIRSTLTAESGDGLPLTW